MVLHSSSYSLLLGNIILIFHFSLFFINVIDFSDFIDFYFHLHLFFFFFMNFGFFHFYSRSYKTVNKFGKLTSKYLSCSKICKIQICRLKHLYTPFKRVNYNTKLAFVQRFKGRAFSVHI